MSKYNDRQHKERKVAFGDAIDISPEMIMHIPDGKMN